MNVDDAYFEEIVNAHYETLYRFALSLARNQSDASDLTQQTFYRWASKGHQLRDRGKIKTWLHTTLYREFLGTRRRAARFSEQPMEDSESLLPSIEPKTIERLDSTTVLETLWEIEEHYRAPLVLFYLDDLSYQQIAETLDIPPGTVMSRLSRGKQALRRKLADRASRDSTNSILRVDIPNQRQA